MDFTNTEVKILEETAIAAKNQQVKELCDLQLAYVGGGNATVDFG